jgi:APA family basic amino acid/polyamine antiporter
MRPVTSSPDSTRPIGFWMAVALVIGNMIGSGIFLLPSSLAPFGGGLSLVGWLVSAAGAVALALVFARLARLDPAAGGPYAYTRRAFGEFAGFFVAWGYWISIWASLGALAVAFVGYLDPFVPALVRSPIAAAVTAVGVVWLLIAVNVAGVRSAGWVQSVTTVLKILPLLIIGVAGVGAFDASHFTIPQTGARAIAGGVSATAALTLWAFLGLETATVPSGSIADPGRTIPRATLVGTLVAAAIYILSTVGVMSLLPPDALGRSTAPFSDAARLLAGDGAARLVALGAAISCFGALNGWVLLVGQLPLAVARDGVFPAVFGRLSKHGTPAAGMLIAGALTTGLIAMNYTRDLVGLFTFIILLSTLSTLVPYVFSSLAVFLIPDDTSGRHNGLRAGAATTAALAFGYSLWAIGGAGADAVYWGFLLLLAGMPVYVAVVKRPRPSSEPREPVRNGPPSFARPDGRAYEDTAHRRAGNRGP